MPRRAIHEPKSILAAVLGRSDTHERDSSSSAIPRNVSIGALTRTTDLEAADARMRKIEAINFNFFYGTFQALNGINIALRERAISSFIGPSGCGKTTLLRAINRMHDITPGAHAEGQILIDQENVYAEDSDPILLRRRIGMVFQRPNAFAKSIYDNVAYGLHIIACATANSRRARRGSRCGSGAVG